MTDLICKNCGKRIMKNEVEDDNGEFQCWECWQKEIAEGEVLHEVKATSYYCWQCGTDCKEDDDRCPECGSKDIWDRRDQID